MFAFGFVIVRHEMSDTKDAIDTLLGKKRLVEKEKARVPRSSFSFRCSPEVRMFLVHQSSGSDFIEKAVRGTKEFRQWQGKNASARTS